MARTTRRGAIRRALRLSTLEGILAEWVVACAGGGALIAWALHLRAPPPLVAALAALPAIGQAAHLPAARLTARLGARRTAVAAAALSRQPYLLLVALPWLPLGVRAKQVVLVGVAVAAAALGAVAQHAWTAWVTALFRAPIRARVLARRSARVAVAGSAASLAVGTVLDRAGGSARGAALAALASVAWATGAASAALLARQTAPRAARRPRGAVRVREALSGRSVQRGLRYVLAWNAGMGVVASASAMLMLQHLGLGFLPIALQGLAVAVAAAASAPAWARLVDRAGVGRVLAASAGVSALLPFLWLAARPGVLWPLGLEASLGGVLLGGHGVALANLPLAVAPRGRRAEVLATYSTAAGLAFATASVTSGWLTAKLPFALLVGGRWLVARKLVLAAGGFARLGAAGYARRAFRSIRGARAPGAEDGTGAAAARSALQT